MITSIRPGLLNAALAAHGGLERFNRVRQLSITVDASGMLWTIKGYPGHRLVNILVDMGPTPKVSFWNLVGDHDFETKYVWTPQRVWKEAPDGSIIDSRDAPREAFKGHSVTTPWDHLHLLYFSGYAMFNYVHAPFYFTWPGFSTREIDNPLKDPISEKWRVLEVTYPDEIPTHCKTQKFYFDEKSILRRLDYLADVVGSGPTAHQLYDHWSVDGVLLPMLRRAVRDPDALIAGGPSAVLLNFHDIAVNDEFVKSKTNL